MSGPNGLSLKDDMAATLQARLSWPQADACAADLIGRFGRMMRDCPLTCQYCRSAPASHLVVTDIGAKDVPILACQSCGEAAIKDSGRFRSWLFALIVAGRTATPVAARED